MSALLVLLLAAAPQDVVISRLFAASPEGAYLSYSWGEHWTELRGDLRGFTGEIRTFLCLAPVVYAGGSEGLFVSDDFGENYRPVDRFPGSAVTTLLAARLYALEPTLFVGTERGLYRSQDGGTKWVALEGPIAGATVHDLIWPGPELFVASSSGLFVTRDQGVSWTRLAAGLPEDAAVTSLALSDFFPVEPTMYAGTESSGLFRSRDGGQSFEAVGVRELGGRRIHDVFWWGALLVVGSSGGAFLSNDAGDSFALVEQLGQREVIAILVPGAEDRIGSELILGTDRGVFKSSDGGATFRAVQEGMGAVPVRDLATFPITPLARERRRVR